ncbi:MAG TPA: transcription elongation factor Spt5 [Nitrososphaera sp.]|jgi:transcriptional antiterminator NusG|nr:transcription elongation factor Spt5 [Nitrososphaera sp.]
MSDRVNDAQEEGIEVENVKLDDDNQNSETETRSAEQQIHMPQHGEEQERATIEAVGPPTSSPPPPQQPTPAIDSKFFAIRTTGGQERVVAGQIQVRVKAKKIGIRSVMVLDSFKGYIIVEAPDSNVAYEALASIRHVRGQIRGDLPFKDIEGYLVKKPAVSELSVDDTVEVIAGPFKSMKAKITRVDYEKQEATVVLLDSPYQIPVTVDANYLKKVAH